LVVRVPADSPGPVFGHGHLHKPVAATAERLDDFERVGDVDAREPLYL